MKKYFSIRKKLNIFLLLVILLAVISTYIITYLINITQIDNYYKNLTVNSAKHCSSMIDSEFLYNFKNIISSDKYQQLRIKAESEDNEKLIEDYLKNKGVWDTYNEQRNMMINYVDSIEDITYMYAIVWEETSETADAYDMYLIDADDVKLYEIGFYEKRESEFEGVYPSDKIDPVISKGDWGWLCSGYYPVYDDSGNIICHIGCDISMEDVIQARGEDIIYALVIIIIGTIIIIFTAFKYINNIVTRPLQSITEEMHNFVPTYDRENAHVINLNIENNDEINDIYREIQYMQNKILDYIENNIQISKETEIAKNIIKTKEEEINQISKDTYRDSLTNVGNKNAYAKKIEELNAKIAKGFTAFAIVMIDINCLKQMNDNYGHTFGDEYLKNCCHIICEVYKNSPVYRIGGDEFAVILVNDDYKKREQKLDEIIQIFIHEYNDKNLSPWERCSAAVGMSDYRAEDKKAELTFRRADEKMYLEKVKFQKENNISR